MVILSEHENTWVSDMAPYFYVGWVYPSKPVKICTHLRSLEAGFNGFN